MPFDPARAAESLASVAAGPVPVPEGGWPSGAPVGELIRSPAAARVATLAANAGLYLFHYEHCAWRELPDDWVPPDRADLAAAPTWEGGVLAERKYQSFRHDQASGAFHPGQRAKWSTHELCHGLVGFAWRADATPWFLATAGRLAELLPVTLWYFLDEAHLRRCPVHARDGALFRAFCPACEAVAACVPDDPDAADRLRDAARFLDRELAAIARSRRLGRPIPNAWATIDLASDGVAYAGAHAPRLTSDTFRRYAAKYLVAGANCHADLDALEARVIAVARAIVEGVPLAPLAPSRAAGAARWQLQDVGWRLATIAHDTAGEAAIALWDVVDRLGDAIDGDPVPALNAAIDAYSAIADEWVLPSPDEAFAAGFDLPRGFGRSIAQMIEGVRSATPLAAELVDLRDEVAAFVAADDPDRALIGVRWSRRLEGPIGDLAQYEAALAAPPPGDEVAAALGPARTERVVLANGLRIYRFGVDVVAMAEQVESGADIDVVDQPTALVIGRLGAGDVVVLDVAEATAAAIEALGDGAVPALDPGEVQSLVDLGVLVPAAWPE
jgi:hypothetical protein